MNEFPEELIFSPKPVIAFLGFPILHSTIINQLSTKQNFMGKEVSSFHVLSMDSDGKVFIFKIILFFF